MAYELTSALMACNVSSKEINMAGGDIEDGILAEEREAAMKKLRSAAHCITAPGHCQHPCSSLFSRAWGGPRVQPPPNPSNIYLQIEFCLPHHTIFLSISNGNCLNMSKYLWYWQDKER